MENVITRESPVFTGMISMIADMEREVDGLLSSGSISRGKWIGGDEACARLGISRRTLQNWRDSGTLPYSVIAGKFYYNTGDMDRLMESNYVREKQ